MFHRFLHRHSDFSDGASTGVGIALPPVTAIVSGVIDLDQQSLPRLSQQRANNFSGTTPLEDWLDNLPARGWDT
jgi:hypothetical protein